MNIKYRCGRCDWNFSNTATRAAHDKICKVPVTRPKNDKLEPFPNITYISKKPVYKNPVVVCVDVDDTLVLWEDKEYIVNTKILTQVMRHLDRGHMVIVWSAGGVDWAERVVKEVGLEGKVIVMAKPSFMWDDKPPQEWTRICYDK